MAVMEKRLSPREAQDEIDKRCADVVLDGIAYMSMGTVMFATVEGEHQHTGNVAVDVLDEGDAVLHVRMVPGIPVIMDIASLDGLIGMLASARSVMQYQRTIAEKGTDRRATVGTARESAVA